MSRPNGGLTLHVSFSNADRKKNIGLVFEIAEWLATLSAPRRLSLRAAHHFFLLRLA
jgi:hypothetical protein